MRELPQPAPVPRARSTPVWPAQDVRSPFAALQRVIFELLARLIQAHAGAHGLANPTLRGFDLLGCGQHLVLVFARNHQYAVGVATYQVARPHARIADTDRDLHRLDLDAILARAHP